MDKLHASRNYIKYKLFAKNIHDIHSPFVFELLNNVINDQTPYYGFDVIESLRAKCLLNEEKIEIDDFGTGIKRTESLSSITKRSVKNKKYAQLLFRLVNRFQTNNILEIGTSLGITTLYLSFPEVNNRIITLEGSHEIAKVALQNFNLLKRKNIELIEGEFNTTLSLAIEKFNRLDLVFFDGNHCSLPTLEYFQKCINHSSDDSIFVFDDIHWSRDMELAWEKIKAHPKVSLTIDLCQMGLVFFRKGIIKQDFTLRF
jgi:predicted O-methyltransferase YrrM